jgi:hypothetical protein
MLSIVGIIGNIRDTIETDFQMIKANEFLQAQVAGWKHTNAHHKCRNSLGNWAYYNIIK